ncbi:MAG: tetratricopeptide repeat protein [Gammaproteobacteria bacterium]|nr:tetratricopeptide repeat protein [Gammaproteobacteria bacterium]
MSLLMDALKKAEQEKKEAAKRLKQTGPNPIADTGEHKIQTSADHDNTGPQEMTISQEIDLSLEPIDPSQPQPPPEATDENVVSENTTELDSGAALKQEAEAERSAELPVENTQEMSTELPSVMDRGSSELSFDNTLDEMLDDDEFGPPFEDSEYAFEETLDSVTASQLVEDIGGIDQPTPVAAHTIFEASKTNRLALGSRWTVIGVFVFLILVAGGAVIHYQTTPTARDIPKPVALPEEIKAQQEALAALPKPALPPEPTLDEPIPAAGEISAPAQDTGETIAEAQPATGDVAMTDDVPVADSTVTPSTGEETSVTIAQTDDSAVEDAVVTQEPATSYTEADMELAMLDEGPVTAEVTAQEFQPIVPATPVTPEMIKISRSTDRPEHSATNQQAYQAYQTGNLARAETLYRESLAKTPENRDALLGLAAIKLHQGDRAAAFLIYRKLLQLNPRDNVARLALLRMQGQADPIRNESVLKLMLAEKPYSPHLYFSLGTLYASQLKWAEAQRAFFEAFSLDNDNPDYALNLAISLDHMGQASAAREFYQRAVDLAGQHPASFSAADIMNRIEAILPRQSS